MKNPSQKRVKEHYQSLRQLSAEALWSLEVPAFNAASAPERLQSVSLIRAVGVVFSESGTASQKEEALAWLRGLLSDPEEKVRRYAMAALPKLGSGEAEESELLERVGRAATDREGRFLEKTLLRVGGRRTLERGLQPEGAPLAIDPQRLQANIARREGTGTIAFHKQLPLFKGLRVHLECRAGLESILLGELAQAPAIQSALRLEHIGRGRLHLRMEGPFSLQALFEMRCFSAVRFPLGELPALPQAGAPLDPAAIAACITAEHTHHVLSRLSEGPVRYRLEFASRRADAALVDAITQRVFARRPALLNDPRQALWEICITETPRSVSLELSPRLRPDPRFAYRQGDVPAASHPPLAAAMARLAEIGRFPEETLWDPFCGSGLELAECVLRGSVGAVFGCDLNPDATRVASENIAAACALAGSRAAVQLETCDFRQARAGAGPEGLSLIITNPPLGKRVPVADLRALIGGVFSMAERRLKPGGRLVLVNPASEGGASLVPAGLRLAVSQKVDLGFGHFPLERWER